MKKPRINVSIVTYHPDFSELRRCLDSLKSVFVDRIIIVDNGNDPSVREFCSQQPEPITYIPSDNKGYGAGHNKAIRLTLENSPEDHYHLILNSDLRFDPAILGEIVGLMDSDSTIGMLQPRLLNPDLTPQYAARRLPSPSDLILRRFLPPKWFSRSRDRYLLKDLDLTRPINVAYVQGSFMFVRARAFRDCGIFDERFFMYPEDIDLTRRVHRKYRTLYYPALTVVHDHRRSSYRNYRMLWIHVSNMVRYFNKWGWIFDSERRKFNRELDRYKSV